MRKKILLNILLLSSLSLFGCKNNNISSNQSSPSVEESIPSVSTSPTDSSVIEALDVNISGKIKNIFDEVISQGSVYYNDSLVSQIQEDGSFSFVIKDIELATESLKIVTIKSEGYLDYELSLDNYTTKDLSMILGEITLRKAYGVVSSLKTPTWTSFENFSLSTTRDENNLLVKLHSDNNVFTSSSRNSEINLFISTNNVSSTRDSNVYRFTISKNAAVTSYNYGGLLISSYKVDSKIVNVDNGLDINLAIPYKMISCDKEDVIGLAMSLYSNNDEQTSNLLTLDKNDVVDTFDPTTYIRVDKDNNAFKNNKNSLNALTDEEKEKLIEGHELRFSVPELNNKKNVADDFYLKATKEADGFVISMVGFGEFKDNEYVKLIFHTSETNGSAWAIQSSDASILVNKVRNAYLTNSTNFWGFVNFTSSAKSCKTNPVYQEYETHFTLTQKVLFEEIPGYSETGKVSLYAMEFGNGTIYDAIDYKNGMLINGMSHGDPADQNSYYVIQKGSNTSSDSVVGDFPIQFATNADNIYAKIERKENSLLLTMRSYSTFDDTDYIRFIIHHEANDCTDWGLLKSDMSISIYKDVAYYQTGMVYFKQNSNNQFHNFVKTIHTPTYSVIDNYFELSLEIEYIEFSYDVGKDSLLKGCLVEYVNQAEYLATVVKYSYAINYENQKYWFSF